MARADHANNPCTRCGACCASFRVDFSVYETQSEGGSVPEPIGANFTNAVSPCGLRDGRFGLLWLDGPDNRAGLHELTLVAADGTLIAVLTPGIDVLDVGIGCAD